MVTPSTLVARVTEHDVVQFEGPVQIRDAKAFAAQLESFVQARVAATTWRTNPQVERALVDKTVALRAHTRWTPGETEVQRGRTIMLEAFKLPSNLPLREFATLAGKSRQQIYKDIDARLVLALNVGPRGQRLPDWQLDQVKCQLTRMVRAAARDVDDWTVYRTLSQPLASLGGRSPVDAVTVDNVKHMCNAVLNALGATL